VKPKLTIGAAGDRDLGDVRELLREYERWTGVDLCFQDFERELAELPGDYSAPGGALLLARVSGQAAGCVAAHRWGSGACEMKRLFVRDEFRGSGCGLALVQRVIVWARAEGFERILWTRCPPWSGLTRSMRGSASPR